MVNYILDIEGNLTIDYPLVAEKNISKVNPF